MLEKLKKRVELFDGIFCVIGDRYCSYKEEGYIDEFYIDSVTENDIQIFYNRITYKYKTFDEMINAKIFNGKSIKDLEDKIFFNL